MDDMQPELENSGSPEDHKDSSLAETEDQFHTNGQQTVAYRVLQVTEGDEQGLIASGAHVAQAVLASPFSGAGGADSSGGSTFAYIPASSVTAGGDGDAVVTNLSQGGQFYVMMSHQDVLQGSRTSGRMATGGGGKYGNRDDRRRTTHNEVERRRRDKINNWIVSLSKLIPDCGDSLSSSAVSKSGILSKACEYIQDLKSANLRLAESLKDSDHLPVEIDMLRQQLEQAREENLILRRTIEQNGLEIVGLHPPDA